MTAVDRLDEQHALIAPAVRYVIEQNDVLPDPAFAALAGVTRRWETALRAVLAIPRINLLGAYARGYNRALADAVNVTAAALDVTP